MPILIIARKERVAAIQDGFDLGDQKVRGLPQIDAPTLRDALPKAQAQTWDMVLFDFDDVLAAGVADLAAILKEYIKAMGDPVRFVILDSRGRLEKNAGLAGRVQLVRDLANAQGVPLKVKAVAAAADEDDIFLSFNEEPVAPVAAPAEDGTSPAPAGGDPFTAMDMADLFGTPAEDAPVPAPLPDVFEDVFAPPVPSPAAPAPEPPVGITADDLSLLFPPAAAETVAPVPAPVATAAPEPAPVPPLPDSVDVENVLSGGDVLADLLGGSPSPFPAVSSTPPAAPSVPPAPVAASTGPDLDRLLGITPTEEQPIDGLAGLLGGLNGGGSSGGGIQSATAETGTPKKGGGLMQMLRSLGGREVVNPHMLFPLNPASIPPHLDKTHYITCWCPKGGTGKTTGAVAVAHYLAWGLGGEGRATENLAKQPRVLLVDLDEFADAYMQSEALRSKYGFDDVGTLPNVRNLYENLGNITNDWGSVTPYLALDPTSGLFMLLPQQNSPEAYDMSMDAAAYTKILDKIGRFFDFVIFDCGPQLLQSPNGLTPFALGKASVIVLVGDQTFPTIIHTVKFFVTIAKRAPMIFSTKDSYIYVVNRYNSRAPSSLAEIKNVMGKFVSEVIEIPSNEEAGLQASYDGQNILFSNDRDIKLAYKRLTEAVLSRIKAPNLIAK